MRDARSLSNDALETLRWRAVAMTRGGATQMSTATALKVHKNTVSTLRKMAEMLDIRWDAKCNTPGPV